jgi:hypothetical protein
MGTLKKTLIFCAAFMALVSAYAQDCASQHLVKTKESHVIKTLEPKLTFEYIKKNRRNPNFVILDIRTPQEFQSGYIEGAINIDYYSPAFPADLDKLDKSKTYFIYCRTGRRTADAIRSKKHVNYSQSSILLLRSRKLLGLTYEPTRPTGRSDKQNSYTTFRR